MPLVTGENVRINNVMLVFSLIITRQSTAECLGDLLVAPGANRHKALAPNEIDGVTLCVDTCWYACKWMRYPQADELETLQSNDTDDSITVCGVHNQCSSMPMDQFCPHT